MKTEHLIGIGLIVAAILLIVYSPIKPSNKIESLKDERDDWMDQAMDLQDDNVQMNNHIDKLNAELDSLKIEWKDEDKDIIERNRYQVPRERNRVISEPVPDQLEWWESKRSNARK